MFEEWEFDFLIYNLKLLYKFLFFLIIYSLVGLICYKFVKYFKDLVGLGFGNFIF